MRSGLRIQAIDGSESRAPQLYRAAGQAKMGQMSVDETATTTTRTKVPALQRRLRAPFTLLLSVLLI